MAKGRVRKRAAAGDTAATVGFEAQLWQAADALRGSMDAAEYKHVVLGLSSCPASCGSLMLSGS